MSDSTINLTPILYAYLKKNSLREPEVLHALRIQTHKMSMGQMQISPEQGQFMCLLIELLGARKTVDIGVFTGYSALSVALALPPEGKVVACDINSEWTKIARRFWEMAGVASKIDLRLAPALETLQLLLDTGEAGTYDFIFIDADKVNYPAYYEISLRLLRPGGLMAIDNVLFGGKVADPLIIDQNTNAIRLLNKRVLEDERVSLSLLPLGDGLTLARKLGGSIMEYSCDKCHMGVKGLTCTKCNAELVKDKVTQKTGGDVQVSKCPNGCGMIKSPVCCGHDMVCQ